jgi:hypothetical protein
VEPQGEADTKHDRQILANQAGWTPAGYWRNETYIPLPGPEHYDSIPDEALLACLQVWQR